MRVQKKNHVWCTLRFGLLLRDEGLVGNLYSTNGRNDGCTDDVLNYSFTLWSKIISEFICFLKKQVEIGINYWKGTLIWENKSFVCAFFIYFLMIAAWWQRQVIIIIENWVSHYYLSLLLLLLFASWWNENKNLASVLFSSLKARCQDWLSTDLSAPPSTVPPRTVHVIMSILLHVNSWLSFSSFRPLSSYCSSRWLLPLEMSLQFTLLLLFLLLSLPSAPSLFFLLCPSYFVSQALQ